jgi:hypothetical protein
MNTLGTRARHFSIANSVLLAWRWVSNLFEAIEQRGPIDDNHQVGFLSLAHHQINFQISKATAIADKLRALVGFTLS